MANDLVLPAGFGPPPALLANAAAQNSELSSGIMTGFPVIGYKGKTWSVKYRGEQTDLLVDQSDPQSPARPDLEVVILKANNHLSKLFYANGYVEGSTEPPDCWSSNGVTPDPTVDAPQAKSCAICPMNQFRPKADGKGKAKRCSDHKRMAVAPLGDLPNEDGGGPMLLRVPAASLKGLVEYSEMLSKANYGYFAVATRLTFDREAAYPKFVFRPIRPLTEAEAAQVLELQADSRVARVLNEEPDAGEAPPTAADNVVPFEQPPKTALQAPQKPAQPSPTQQAPKPVAPVQAKPAVAATKPSPIGAALANPAPIKKAGAPVTQATPKPAPVEEPAAQGEVLDEIDAALEGLL